LLAELIEDLGTIAEKGICRFAMVKSIDAL
jgi:hypothetical protein